MQIFYMVIGFIVVLVMHLRFVIRIWNECNCYQPMYRIRMRFSINIEANLRVPREIRGAFHSFM